MGALFEKLGFASAGPLDKGCDRLIKKENAKNSENQRRDKAVDDLSLSHPRIILNRTILAAGQSIGRKDRAVENLLVGRGQPIFPWPPLLCNAEFSSCWATRPNRAK